MCEYNCVCKTQGNSNCMKIDRLQDFGGFSAQGVDIKEYQKLKEENERLKSTIKMQQQNSGHNHWCEAIRNSAGLCNCNLHQVRRLNEENERLKAENEDLRYMHAQNKNTLIAAIALKNEYLHETLKLKAQFLKAENENKSTCKTCKDSKCFYVTEDNGKITSDEARAQYVSCPHCKLFGEFK